MSNKLTVYSNGTTRIQRVVKIEGRTTVSIPVRKKAVADVLATVAVFGNVRMVEPPSYTNDSAKNVLKIDSANVHFSLITRLSGAKVKIVQSGQPYEGRLLGAHTQEVTHPNGTTSTSHHVQIIDSSGTTRQFNEGTYATLTFLEPEVQRLIDTALSNNFESVRPDSVLVKLVLEPVTGNAADGRIEYAIPTSAWQSIYQLRVGSKQSTLEYNAKIDNPTDEDWLKTKVSVVVGEPITLDTTLGEVKTLTRSKVDLVGSKAAGPIRAQSTLSPEQIGVLRSASARGGNANSRMYALSSMKGGGAENLECSDESEYEAAGCSFGSQAQVSGATAEEVGDFAVFTSDDEIDVKAGQSGVVRLFNKPLEANEVLFFDKVQDPDRAYRGVRFTNTTGNSLGQGICTVYLGDTLAGQFEFKALKAGQSKTGVFARENGVVATSSVKQTNTRIGVGVKSGSAWSNTRTTNETTYTFVNSYKDTAFDVEVGHDFTLGDNVDLAVTTGINLNRTKTGVKLTAKLPAGGTLTFVLSETKSASNAWNVVGSGGLQTILSVIGDDKKLIEKLKATPAYKNAEKLAEELQALHTTQNELTSESSLLKEEQRRLLSLVQSGSAAAQLSKWQGELDVSEDRIKAIDKTLLKNVKQEIKTKQAEFDAAMKVFIFDADEAKTA